MFKKTTLRLGLSLMLLLLMAVPAFAQDNWFAYLFNNVNGQIVRVYADGRQETFNLDLAPNTYIGGYDMAFSADGSRLAFCAIVFDGVSSQGQSTLYVRDIAAGTNLVTRDMGASIGCKTGRYGFSADGSQLTVALANYYVGDTAADPSQPAWQLLIVDAATGNTLNEINAASPAAAQAGMLPDLTILPEVRYFANNQIIFSEVPYGIGGASEFPAYLWQVDTGAVSQETTGHWVSFSQDYLTETGEVAWVSYDPTLPAGEPGGPVPASNVVQIADKSGETRTIYHNPDWVLLDATFINNGQQLAILELEPFNPEAAINQNTRLIALDRTGTITELALTSFYTQHQPAPAGYVELMMQANEDFTSFNTVLTLNSGGSAVTLWSLPESGWELVWSMPTPVTPGLTAFPTFSPQ